MKIKLITVWETYHKDTDTWTHNHISNGWEFGYNPKPKFDTQKMWLSGLWRSEFGFLYNNKVILPWYFQDIQ